MSVGSSLAPNFPGPMNFSLKTGAPSSLIFLLFLSKNTLPLPVYEKSAANKPPLVLEYEFRVEVSMKAGK